MLLIRTQQKVGLIVKRTNTILCIYHELAGVLTFCLSSPVPQFLSGLFVEHFNEK